MRQFLTGTYYPLDGGAPAPGVRLQVLALAGRGGHARVYACADPWGGDDLAVKTQRIQQPRLACDAARELVHNRRMAARGARVLPIHAVIVEDTDEPLVGLVLPLAPAVLSGGLAPDAAARAAAGLCAAVRSCHDAGFAHGDVKPANAVFDASGDVMLIDASFASPLAPAPREDPVFATTLFSAPDQLAAAANDAPPADRTDCYALGVSLLCLCGGPSDCPITAARPLDMWAMQALVDAAAACLAAFVQRADAGNDAGLQRVARAAEGLMQTDWRVRRSAAWALDLLGDVSVASLPRPSTPTASLLDPRTDRAAVRAHLACAGPDDPDVLAFVATACAARRPEAAPGLAPARVARFCAARSWRLTPADLPSDRAWARRFCTRADKRQRGRLCPNSPVPSREPVASRARSGSDESVGEPPLLWRTL